MGPQFGAFVCSNILQPDQKRKACTAYSANMITQAIAEQLLVAPKSKVKELRPLVQPLCNLPVTDSIIRSAVAKAERQISGQLHAPAAPNRNPNPSLPHTRVSSLTCI